jgi:hypothetical protein
VAGLEEGTAAADGGLCSGTGGEGSCANRLAVVRNEKMMAERIIGRLQHEG